MIVACLCLGGCASYQSVSGRVYGPGAGALDEALHDSGSTSLSCDPSRVHVRRFVTGGYRQHQHILMAEGCGQRASYVVDCSDHSPPCPAGGLEVPNTSCTPYQEPVASCELVLVSRVRLD